MQAIRVDDFENKLLGFDHLANDCIARCQHAADRRHQCLAAGQASTDRGDPPLQAEHFGFCGIDFLLRHRVGQIAQARQPLFRQTEPGLQIGQGGRLIGPLDGTGRRYHPGQHLALLHPTAGRRQTVQPGRLDAPGLHGLNTAAKVRIHDHPAGQFQRTGNRLAARLEGQHAHAALRRLGNEHRAVSQALRLVADDGRRFVGIAVIVPLVGKTRGGQAGAQRKHS